MASVISSASLDGGAVVVNQIISAGHRDGAQNVMESTGGSVDPSLIGISTFEPVTSVVTSDIATLLSLSGGLFCNAGYCSDALSTIPMATREDCGVFSGLNSHVAIQGFHNLMVPTSIEAGANSATATMTVEHHWTSMDGFSASPVPSTGNALTVGSFIGSYVCGKAFHNGDRVTELQSFSVNPGITVEVQRDSGLPYPTKVFITKREPTITLTFENQDQAIIALNSLKIQSAFGGAGVYLRKRLDGGLYVDDTSASHIKLGFLGGLTRLESFNGVSTGGNSTFSLVLHGKLLSCAVGVIIP